MRAPPLQRRRTETIEFAMPYLVKKVGGLGLVLLGGLIVVHGLAIEWMWEAVVGLIMMAIGAGLLALKILRRNTVQTGREP